MPFSEDESKPLCKVIDKINKQNRKLESEKKKRLDSYSCMKIRNGEFIILDGILDKETFSDILKKKKGK